MPLILTGVGVYSTSYVDHEGVERRVTIRLNQDAEALGLPGYVLERLKLLQRRGPRGMIPYFTQEGPEPDKPALPTPTKKAEEAPSSGPISAASLNKVMGKRAQELKEAEAKAREEAKEQPQETKEVEVKEETPKSTPSKRKKPAAKKPAAKKASAKKAASKKTTAKKSSSKPRSSAKKAVEKPSDKIEEAPKEAPEAASDDS